MAKGVILVVAIWAALIAWVARTARSSGHNIAGWTFVAGVAGVVAFVGGLRVAAAILDADGLTTIDVLAVLAPIAFMMAVMSGIAIALSRGAFGPPRATKWRVHVHERGAATLRLASDRLHLAWEGGEREITFPQLERVELDGELVRITAGEELVLMPLDDEVDTAARRRRSKQIATRLQSRFQVPVAAVTSKRT